MRVLEAADGAEVGPEQLDREPVLAVERERVGGERARRRCRAAAPRCAGPASDPGGRDTSASPAHDRGADRQRADRSAAATIALEQRRRHAEEVGDVVEAERRIVGRQQRRRRRRRAPAGRGWRCAYSVRFRRRTRRRPGFGVAAAARSSAVSSDAASASYAASSGRGAPCGGIVRVRSLRTTLSQTSGFDTGRDGIELIERQRRTPRALVVTAHAVAIDDRALRTRRRPSATAAVQAHGRASPSRTPAPHDPTDDAGPSHPTALYDSHGPKSMGLRHRPTLRAGRGTRSSAVAMLRRMALARVTHRSWYDDLRRRSAWAGWARSIARRDARLKPRGRNQGAADRGRRRPRAAGAIRA